MNSSTGIRTTLPPAVADYPRGASMAPRVIDDIEFVWMLRGQAHLVTGEGQRLLAPGHLAVITPGVRHGFAWDQQRPCRHGYVHFRAAPALTPPPGIAVRRMTDEDPLRGLCAYLLWLGREQADGWETWLATTLATLLEWFTAAPLPQVRGHRSPPWAVTSAIDILREEWAQTPLRRITVGALAARAYVSPSYLNRVFRSEFGVSVAAALEGLRCLRAETLLTRTTMAVGEVALQCGFADLPHFSHRFRARYGTSPRAYRAAGGIDVSALEPGIRRLADAVWP